MQVVSKIFAPKLSKFINWFLSYSRKCRRCFFETQCSCGWYYNEYYSQIFLYLCLLFTLDILRYDNRLFSVRLIRNTKLINSVVFSRTWPRSRDVLRTKISGLGLGLSLKNINELNAFEFRQLSLFVN